MQFVGVPELPIHPKATNGQVRMFANHTAGKGVVETALTELGYHDLVCHPKPNGREPPDQHHARIAANTIVLCKRRCILENLLRYFTHGKVFLFFFGWFFCRSPLMLLFSLSWPEISPKSVRRHHQDQARFGGHKAPDDQGRVRRCRPRVNDGSAENVRAFLFLFFLLFFFLFFVVQAVQRCMQRRG